MFFASLIVEKPFSFIILGIKNFSPTIRLSLEYHSLFVSYMAPVGWKMDYVVDLR